MNFDDTEVPAMKAKIEELGKSCLEWETLLEDRDKKIEHLEFSLKEKDKKAEELAEDKKDCERRLEACLGALEEKDQTIKALQDEVQAAKDANAGSLTEVDTLRRTMAQLLGKHTIAIQQEKAKSEEVRRSSSLEMAQLISQHALQNAMSLQHAKQETVAATAAKSSAVSATAPSATAPSESNGNRAEDAAGEATKLLAQKAIMRSITAVAKRDSVKMEAQQASANALSAAQLRDRISTLEELLSVQDDFQNNGRPVEEALGALDKVEDCLAKLAERCAPRRDSTTSAPPAPEGLH